jgi:hypothetical protein
MPEYSATVIPAKKVYKAVALLQGRVNLKNKDGGQDDRIESCRNVFHLLSFF